MNTWYSAWGGDYPAIIDVLLDKTLVSHCGEGDQTLARFLGKLMKQTKLPYWP